MNYRVRDARASRTAKDWGEPLQRGRAPEFTWYSSCIWGHRMQNGGWVAEPCLWARESRRQAHITSITTKEGTRKQPCKKTNTKSLPHCGLKP